MDERVSARRRDKMDERHEEAAASVYHVVSDADHGWKVKLEGADVSSPGYPMKREAVARAEDLAKMSENGRVIVHGINGEIETTYAPFAAEMMRRTG